MKIILAFYVMVFCSSVVWANDAVKLRDTTTQEVFAISGSRYSLFIDESSGDASSETAPLNIYLPLDNSSLSNQNDYFYQSISGKRVLDVTTLNRNTMAVIFPLRVTIGTTAKYITSAVKVSGDYRVVTQSDNLYDNLTNSNIDFPISPAEFCAIFPLSGSSNPCLSNAVFTTDLTTYFFVTETAMASGDTVDVSQLTNGIYFLLKMSNRVSSITPTVSNARVGDRRITLEYNSNAVLSNAKFVRVFDHGSSKPTLSNRPIGEYSAGSLLTSEFNYVQNGEVVVSDLTNRADGEGDYIFSLLFVDKYGFATVLSNDVSAKPKAIEELLKKEACFLLTAGFGEEHFVIDYFRNYRDHYLAKSYLGKKFIKIYYELSPKYALLLYKSETLRTLVRGMGFALYFIFNYIVLFWTFLIFLFGAGLFIFYKNKEKITT